MEFRVLGPLDVQDGDRSVPLGGFRQRLVLAVLILYADRPLSTDWLVDAVWGEEPPRTARKTLQVYVSRLRHVLGQDVIEATSHGYMLHLSPGNLDSEQFERLADQGGQLLGTDPGAAAGVFRRSLALWRGLPWGELGNEPAIQPEAQRLRELRLSVLGDRISADLESGHAHGLIGELEGLVEEHPLREGFRLELMLALYRSGRQADALRLFKETSRVLGEELGIEPSRDLRDLEEQILLQDPAIDGPTTVPVDDWSLARNPYKGLRSFGAEDAEDFFGRDSLIDEIEEAIQRHALVAVVGASGSGKSSAVRCGLLPRLRASRTGSDNWIVATMVPGHRPFAQLETAVQESTPGATELAAEAQGDDLDILRIAQKALPDDTTRMLLVVDQFEELFHQVTSQPERTRFVRNLIEAAEDPHSQLTLLLTLRADFLDLSIADASLGHFIAEGMITVLPLTPAELEAAAARPAERVGTYLEPELIAELVSDMTNQPGALPLFQYVLTQLFINRTSTVLTRSTYRRIGGLRGALAGRAEETYHRLDESQRVAARQLFLRLVTVGEDEYESRRRVERAEIEGLVADATAVKTALDAFDEARLVSLDRNPVSGHTTVEVAHEALLREWPRLRGWLDETHDDLRLHRTLTGEVAQWEASGRDPDYLLTGSRLALYEGRSNDSAIELTRPEQDFLTACIGRRDHERAAEEERREQELRVEQRSVRRLRWLVGVVSIAALVAVALTLFATNQSRNAAASQREARARELANASLANLDTDPELAVLLALESLEITGTDDGTALREAAEALHLSVNSNRLIAKHNAQWGLAFHPDGHLFVGGRSPRLIDPVSGETLIEIPERPGESVAESVAVSTDGSLLATGTDKQGELIVWDANTGAEVVELHGQLGTVLAIEFSPDDRVLAAVSISRDSDDLQIGHLLVWDIATGDLITRADDSEAWDVCCPPVDLTFSPNGHLVAVTTFSGEHQLEGEVRLLEIASGQWEMTLRGHNGPATGVEYLPDGDTIVTTSMDGSVRFWDATTGEQLSSFNADVGQVVSLDVSEDGSRLLVGGDGGKLKLWALQPDGPRVAADLPGHNSLVIDVDLDGLGDTAASIDLSGAVLVWNVAPSGAGEVAGWSARRPVAFSDDGSLIATTGPAGRDVVIRRTVDWQPELTLADVAPYVGLPEEDWGQVTGLSFSPQADQMVTTTGTRLEVVSGSVTLWDMTSGEPIRTLLEHPFMKGPVAFSGDGRRLAVATCDAWGTPASVRDTSNGESVFTPPAGPCGQAVDLDSTGGLLAVQTVADDQPNVQVWDMESGDLVLSVTHRPQWIGVVTFSPDDSQLLTGGADGTARIWDVVTGRLVRTLTGHTGSVEDAVWSADGAEIVTGSHDGTVRLWDAETGETRLVLGDHDTFTFVAISPNGRYLATGTDTGVRVWALDLNELIEIARERVPRSLTAAECIAYYFEECPSTP